MEVNQHLDLCVVGAGMYGLMAAKTYLDVYPSADILVLERGSSLGGVWSLDRLNPGVLTNNIAGQYEFSDFPMSEERFGVKWGQHIPGKTMYDYLCAFAETFDISSKIRCNCQVHTIEKRSTPGWILQFVTPEGNSSTISTSKLIIASGLASDPVMPHIPGSEAFNKPILHCKDLGLQKGLYKTASSVAIVGGSKSAWDAAYQFAASGVEVNWILRDSGHGPVRCLPARNSIFNIWMELLVTMRLTSWLSPCPWDGQDEFPRVPGFLQRFVIGRLLMSFLWWLLEMLLSNSELDRNAETKKLKPWGSKALLPQPFSAHTFPPAFLDYITDGRIKVYRSDIEGLTPSKVHLKSGECLQVDAVIVSGGWTHRPKFRFIPSDLSERMGFPGHNDPAISKVDRQILADYPCLNQSSLAEQDTTKSRQRPWTLYRFMAPPSFIDDHSIGFVGFVAMIMNAPCAQAQALWLTAYLGGPTKNPTIKPNPTEAQHQALHHSRFSRWRYPGSFAYEYPHLFWDGLPYIDCLMKDLGLDVRRKPTLLAEIFEPYTPSEYRELVGEWLGKERSRKMSV